MSDHHHHHHRSSSSSFYKDSYGSSSKRYHSPSDSGRIGGGLGGSGGGFYESSSKRSRPEAYVGPGSLHTSSSSARYNDYSSSSSSLLSNRYNKTSFYDTPGGLKPSSSASSKYLGDYKGRSTIKSSVRRIPPPLTPPSMSSSKSLISSSSNRPLPLMKVITSSSVGGGSGGRDNYGGSRLRTAPPEHHGHGSSSFGYPSSRKPDFKRPALYQSKFGAGSSYGRSAVNAFKKGTLRAAATVTSKIRRRATDDRKVLRVRVDPLRRDDKRFPSRHYQKPKVDSKDKSKDLDSKNDSSNKEEDKKLEIDLPGGEVAVVLDEVGGDSDEEETQKKRDAAGENDKEKVDESMEVDGSSADKTDGAEDADKMTVCVHDEHEEVMECKKRGSSESRKSDRDSSPSSRALLKLYCKYCDSRHVTFREYSGHLRSFPHTKAMNTAVTDMRKQLSKLRNQQRDDQRKLEKEEKVLSDTTSYCRVCELNFRSDPKEHEANELHNEIKTIIYQRCDVCEIDFRIWKVYLYHMAALEHVKRVAMKELKDAESKGDNVKGTNLTQEELGLDLVEVRTVFFCNACVRYIPIKGDHDEDRSRHCMTLTHIKCVDEYRLREKRIQERQKKRLEREEKEAKMNEKIKEEQEKDKDSKTSTDENMDLTDIKVKTEGCDELEQPEDVANERNEDSTLENAVDKSSQEVKIEKSEEAQGIEPEGGLKDGNVEDVDEDEIELHAGDDVADDEESEDTNSVWNRRTRSGGRGGSSSKTPK